MNIICLYVIFNILQPVGFVTFSSRVAAEAAKQDLQVTDITTQPLPYLIPVRSTGNRYNYSAPTPTLSQTGLQVTDTTTQSVPLPHPSQVYR